VTENALEPWADQRTPALAIVARGDQIRPIAPTRYEVRSQSRPDRKYSILVRNDRWVCSCAFHRCTHRVCIHILAIRYRANLGDPADRDSRTEEGPHCGSPNVIRFGRRYNRSRTVNRYLCNACRKRFTSREGVLRLRFDARTVALALDLYFRGLSLRKVSDHFRQAYGLSVSPATIYGWISRFTPQAARWMDSLARTGEQWNLDETVVKSDGNPRWVWNIVDARTRFLMATHVTKLRRQRDARMLLRRAKGATPDRPLTVLSDGMPAYRKAIGRELAFRSGAQVVNPHLRVPSIRAKRSNNLVERLHGTEKERIKVTRGFHGSKGPKTLMEGFRVHYNMVRSHEALGTTPGVAAGLPDPGGFRWKEIIDKASHVVPRGQVEIVFVVG
jgi:putative transposase